MHIEVNETIHYAMQLMETSPEKNNTNIEKELLNSFNEIMQFSSEDLINDVSYEQLEKLRTQVTSFKAISPVLIILIKKIQSKLSSSINTYNPFLNLPPELHLQIAFLSPKNCLPLFSSSKKLYEYTREDRFWKMFARHIGLTNSSETKKDILEIMNLVHFGPPLSGIDSVIRTTATIYNKSKAFFCQMGTFIKPVDSLDSSEKERNETKMEKESSDSLITPAVPASHFFRVN